METVERRELPGNDASWYQALLGEQDTSAGTAGEVSVEPMTPSPDDTSGIPASAESTQSDATSADEAAVALLDAPTEIQDGPDDEDAAAATPEEPDTAETATVAAVPPLEIDDSPIENTSEMVGQLWTAPDTAGPLDDWEPDEMDRAISSSRKFRWSSVVAAISVVSLIAVGLVLLPSITRSRADNHRDMFTTTLGDLRGELPDTQMSLAVATNPVSDAASLADLATQLTTLAAKTSLVDEAAQTDLPVAPPLTSSEPIDDLEPLRQRIEPLGTVAATIQRRISNLAEYRILMDGFLVLPELPVTADSSAQAELRVTLAAAQADSASILTDLPGDVSLDTHRSLARDINDRFATWQVDYLEALRTEDSTIARNLVAELTDALAELEDELVTPLAQIRRQTDADIIDLASAIDEVVLLVSGGPQAP